MSDKDPGVRLNQAILLLAGAIFLVAIVAPEDGRFYWTPLTIGLAYLGAAIAGGLSRERFLAPDARARPGMDHRRGAHRRAGRRWRERNRPEPRSLGAEDRAFRP
jgi:hypothetical protein